MPVAIKRIRARCADDNIINPVAIDIPGVGDRKAASIIRIYTVNDKAVSTSSLRSSTTETGGVMYWL